MSIGFISRLRFSWRLWEFEIHFGVSLMYLRKANICHHQLDVQETNVSIPLFFRVWNHFFGCCDTRRINSVHRCRWTLSRQWLNNTHFETHTQFIAPEHSLLCQVRVRLLESLSNRKIFIRHCFSERCCASSCTSSSHICSVQTVQLYERAPRRDIHTLHPIAHYVDVWWYWREHSSQGCEPNVRHSVSTKWSDSVRRGEIARRHLFNIHLGTQQCQTSQQQTWYLTKQVKGQSWATTETVSSGDPIRIRCNSEQEVMNTFCSTSRSTSWVGQTAEFAEWPRMSCLSVFVSSKPSGQANSQTDGVGFFSDQSAVQREKQQFSFGLVTNFKKHFGSKETMCFARATSIRGRIRGTINMCSTLHGIGATSIFEDTRISLTGTWLCSSQDSTSPRHISQVRTGLALSQGRIWKSNFFVE